MWARLPASRGLLSVKRDRIPIWRLAAILTLPALLGLPACARAHVIPNDAKIELILKPEGQRLRLLVRVPLQTMVDLEYPTRGTSQDFVDLDRADRVLNDAAGLWLVNNLEAYENNRLAPGPADRRRSRLARLRRLIRLVRTSPGPRPGPPTDQQRGFHLEPGPARRVARVPHSIRSVPVLDPLESEQPRAQHDDVAAVPAS